MPAEQAAAPLVEATGIEVVLGSKTVLTGIDLAVRPGEIVTLIGPNGAGKTTLVRVVLGLAAPNGGAVARQAGLRIGYVPQRLAVDRTLPLTVRRFLGLPRARRLGEMRQALGAVRAEGLLDFEAEAPFVDFENVAAKVVGGVELPVAECVESREGSHVVGGGSIDAARRDSPARDRSANGNEGVGEHARVGSRGEVVGGNQFDDGAVGSRELEADFVVEGRSAVMHSTAVGTLPLPAALPIGRSRR